MSVRESEGECVQKRLAELGGFCFCLPGGFVSECLKSPLCVTAVIKPLRGGGERWSSAEGACSLGR